MLLEDLAGLGVFVQDIANVHFFVNASLPFTHGLSTSFERILQEPFLLR
jgi:hypothetical protein